MKNVTWDEVSEGDQIEMLSIEEYEMVDGAWGWRSVVRWVARGFFTAAGGIAAHRLFSRN